MRHHAQSIELNQSWTGPYDQYTGDVSRDSWGGPDDLSTKGNPPQIDSYPSDILAALQARADRLDEVVADMAQQVEALQRPTTPAPYPPDLLAAIPWAKDAGLELIELKDGTWLYVTETHYREHPGNAWHPHLYKGNARRLYVRGHPTREAALKSPPPKPPGFGEAKMPDSPTLTVGPQTFTVSGIPKGHTVHISANTAQPSVGERLGRIAENVYFNTSMEGETLWDEVALAARREVLKEGFAEEDTEAAAKAFWNATLPGIAWDELREASRKPIRVQAAAALSAAIASRAERAEREGKQ